jgi:hypothetical protein
MCVLSVIVFILTATPGVCERASFEETFADATSVASTDNATIVAKSNLSIVASRSHVHNHDHANASQALVLSSRSSRRAVTGSVLMAVEGYWKPSEVLLLVFNMIGDLFGKANAAFTAAQELISITVPDELFQSVSDSIGNAFGSGFGVGTASAAAALDFRSLCTKFSEFKWDDPSFAPCFTLRRATAMLDMMLDFLSFAANVASFLGDSVVNLAPPVNLWLSAGGRIAGGIIWVLQTFALPILQAQSCGLEGSNDADAIYAEANPAQMAQVESAKEAACRTPSPTAHVVACMDAEESSRPCDKSEIEEDSTKPGKECRPWTSWRMTRCYDLEKEKMAVKKSACEADSSAQLQTDVISVISSARQSAIREFGITGEEAITEATATRGGGVGGSQLAGKRDLGTEKRTLMRDPITGEMTWSNEPSDEEKAQLKECCKMKGMCLHAAEVERETNPSNADILLTKCTKDVSVCLQRMESCAPPTKKRFCTQAYFSELSPCCPKSGPDRRHCSEDHISDEY